MKDVGSGGKIHLTYKGAAYTLAELQAKLTAANGKNFSEHNNTHTDGDPNSGLLFTNDTVLIDADTYNTLFYSQQIATNGKDGSPNNLGYDIDLGLVIDKAVLTVTGNTVKRTYGNTTADKDYINGLTGWVGREQGKDHANDWTFTRNTLANGGDGGLKNDTQTSNAGNNYTWKGVVTLNGDIAKNYDIQFQDSKGNTTLGQNGSVTASDQSIVNKANLIITAGDVERTYGNAAITNGNYNIAFDKTQGWVNGDAGTKDTDYTYDGMTSDGGLDHTAGDQKITANAGDNYTWKGKVTLKGDAANNYNIQFKDASGTTDGKNGAVEVGGKSIVNKANLIITAGDVERTYGNAAITKGDYDIAFDKTQGWVNGDAGTKDTDYTYNGMTSDGGLDTNPNDKRETANVGEYKWTGNVTLKGDAANNYTIQFKDADGTTTGQNGTVAVGGKSIVNKANLIITAGDVERTYGNAAITNGNYNIAFDKTQGWVNGDAGTKDTDYTYNGMTSDGGLDTNPNDKRETANADTYTWTGNVTLKGDALNNYNIQFKDADGTTTGKNGTVEVGGKSIVNKANLIITAGDVERTYGNAAITKGNYDIAFDKTQGWVNGDAGTKDTDYTYDGMTSDGGLDTNPNDKRETANVGEYKWTGNVTLKGDAANNYTIQFKDADGTTTGQNGTVEVGGKSIVNKAQLTVNVGNASTTYGTPFDEKKYNYNVAGNMNGDTVDGLKQLLGGTYDNEQAFNEANGKKTGEVGTYQDVLKLVNTNELKNYDVTVDNGDVTIDKAHLTVNVGNAYTEYGTAFDPKKYGYTVEGEKNGDTNAAVKNLIGGTVTNDQAFDGTNGKWTGDAGTHTGAMNLTKYNDALKNYDVTTVNKGDAVISKAQLHINANDAMTNVGIPPKYTGSDINAGLKNGDTISNADYHYGVKDTSVESIIGTHSGVIGLWHRNQFYTFDSIGGLGKAYPFLKNYNVLFTPGTLIVREIPTGQWDWLYKDYPWDKIKNFRERRAELHYVDGGVFIEQ